MSNSLEIHNRTAIVEFDSTEFDIDAFEAWVKTCPDRPTNNPETHEAAWKNIGFWFLATNYRTKSITLIGSDLTLTRTRRISFFFGHGRSTHTFRDFESTLMVLAQFLKPDAHPTHTFRCFSHEDPGWFTWTIDFGDPKFRNHPEASTVRSDGSTPWKA